MLCTSYTQTLPRWELLGLCGLVLECKILMDLQDWNKAVTYCRLTIPVYGRVYPRFHPLRGLQYYACGKLEWLLGYTKEAIKSLTQAVDVLCILHGTTSPFMKDLIIKWKTHEQKLRSNSHLRMIRLIMPEGLTSSNIILLFKKLQDSELKPDVVTYNSLINGLCCLGTLDEALALRDKMVGSGVKPTLVTYNGVMNGFSMKKMVKNCEEVFDDIPKQGLVALFRAGNLEKAAKLHGQSQ
ncbi:Pentatricopeptide repeat-containing protein [Cynara cardunculus var. scolymus]|uniref:Pentatricopeptide repeat-containing protein n=1 Tax=Cynara cardunculus var. scolymus TaxID=59895 RepID=A0A118JS24_CYNCS|nr:Pentatricopeptide repeat-containing protein [Cynara cardunculus var. scolymus]